MADSDRSFSERVRSLLGVEAGEERAVGWMAALYFLLAASFVFVQTSAYGLFLQEFGARNLPFAYLSIAAFASALAYLYLKLSERVAFRALTLIDLGFLAAACALFWLGLQTGLKHWFIFLLPFWFQAMLNLANLVVWPLAGRMFDVRQAKRLFGVVGSGLWLGNILLGGFVVAPLLAFAGPADLYLFAAIAVVAASLVLRFILGSLHVPAWSAMPTAAAASPGQAEKPRRSPFRNPYNRYIFGYILLWWVSFYFIDNIFFDRAGAMYPGGSQLAAFLGKQISVIGIIALITTTLITGRLVRRFGVRIALLVMPVIVLFFTLLLVAGGLLQAPTPALFWMATAAKTMNLALGFSLSQAAGTLLYQPILGSDRHRTQTIAEGIVQPFAIGLAGLLLLVFNTILHFDAVGLSAVFLVIGALWVWIILRVSGEYPRVLSEALVRRSLGESSTLLFDPAGIAQLESGLKRSNAGAVLYALNQLEQLEPYAWEGRLRASLAGLLAHPAQEVRLYVLERILSLKLVEAAPLVRSRLETESVPDVRAAVVEFLAAVDDASPEEIEDALRSPEQVMRRGAITGLLLSASPAQIERATGLLGQLAASASDDDRLMAVDILAEATCAASKELLFKLLSDDVVAVRQGAVRAAGRQEDEGLLKEVVAACNGPETAPVAEQVLISKGQAALPAVLAAFAAMDPASAAPGAFALVRVLGSIGGEHAENALEPWMDCPDGELRLQVLRSLGRVGYRLRTSGRLVKPIWREVTDAAWLVGAVEALSGEAGKAGLAALSSALELAFRETRQRVMLLLSFGMDARSVLRASSALDEADGNPPAFALEAIDAMLPSGWKPLILPLIENLTRAQRMDRWKAAGIPVPALSIESVIQALIGPEPEARFSRWVTLCALHAAGALQLRSCRSSLEALSSVPDAAVSELSCWSLAHMGFDVSVQGGSGMLSLVEKVLALKSANLFRQTPDNILADVADRVDEVSFGRDEIIFRKGDRGDSLYVIVSGRVDVHDGERLLNELGEGAIFGELALLEPAPRSATVKATEPAHLLQLNESHFRTVLAERPEVATAVIHVLTSYIRGLLAGGEGSVGATPTPGTLQA